MQTIPITIQPRTNVKRALKCTKCGSLFESIAINTAKCRSCGFRFVVTEQTILTNVVLQKKEKPTFSDFEPEIAPKAKLDALFSGISPITQLPVPQSETQQKFIDMDEIAPLLEMGKGVFDKVGINMDDMKGIIDSLNKIAIKRGWLNKFGGMSDNEDEIDLFFKIFTMASGGIQNYIAKKDLEKQLKEIGDKAAKNKAPAPAIEPVEVIQEPARFHDMYRTEPEVKPILPETPKVKRKYRHHKR